MKKVLALFAALVLFTSSSFAGDLSLPKVKLYGEGSIQSFRIDNMDGDWNLGGTVGVFTLGAAISLAENVTASLALGYYNYWGESYGTEGKHISGGGDGYLNLIRVVEANIALKNLFDVEGLSAKVGRQFYGDEDSMVMFLGVRNNTATNFFNMHGWSPANMIAPITSIEAMTLYYEKENIKANAIYGMFSNQSTGEYNQTLKGADFKYFNIADMFDAQAYLYSFEHTGYQYYTIFGLKPTFKYNDFKASIEFAKNFGGNEIFSNEYANTNFIKLDASYDVKDINLTPRLSYFVGGGEYGKGFYAPFGNATPRGLVATALFNNWGDQLFSFYDEAIFNIGADYKYEKYSFALDIFNYNGRDNGDNFNLGNEVDFTVKYAYTDNVSINFIIGHLFMNDDWYNGTDVSTTQLGVSYKF
ncbi:MAG: hypothetical protein FWD54_01715 [Endomicrobia bacterium]|nr:hypothetical protein [Endomicrobiia bacterium]MCL2798987.1 hypothetical protein [Endomicrobiia bacterium]